MGSTRNGLINGPATALLSRRYPLVAITPVNGLSNDQKSIAVIKKLEILNLDIVPTNGLTAVERSIFIKKKKSWFLSFSQYGRGRDK